MKIFGLLSVLMNTAGDALAGGGGGIAVTESAGPESTAIVPSGDGDTSQPDDTGSEGADLQRTDDTGVSRSRTAANPAVALLKQHPEHVQWANDAQRALGYRARIRSEFPGKDPVVEIARLKKLEKELGGERGFAEMQSDLAELQEIDKLYANSDPRMLDYMTETDAGKSAFVKLAPHIINKFRSLAPKAFASTFANLFLGSMKYDMLNDDKGNPVEPADLPLRLRRLAAAIPKENELAMGELNALFAYVNLIQGLTQVEPERFVPQQSTVDNTRERELNERETKLLQTEWIGARDALATQITQRIWGEETKGKSVSSDDRRDTESLFQMRLQRAINSVPNYKSTVQHFFDTKDKEGYLAYQNSLLQDHIPATLKIEIRKLLPRLAALKPGQRTGATTEATTTTRQTPAPLQQGFRRLPAKPSDNDLDYTQMNKEMIIKHQGVLRRGNSQGMPAGSKVSW